MKYYKDFKMYGEKQIRDWKEFKFDRNELTPPSGQSAFSEKENKILDGIGEFIESQIDAYPSNKFKHYDILQECLLASLRNYKKNNSETKKNEDYIEFFMFEILEKAVKDIKINYCSSLPESLPSVIDEMSPFPPSHQIERD